MFKITLSRWRNGLFVLSRVVRGQTNKSSGYTFIQSVSAIIRVSIRAWESHSKGTISQSRTDLHSTTDHIYICAMLDSDRYDTNI